MGSNKKNKMKLLVLAICAFSAITMGVALEALEKLKAEVANTATECAKENGAPEDELDNFLNNVSTPESHSGQCMTLCVAQHMGSFDADGKYSEAGTKTFFEPIKNADEGIYDVILAIAEKCGKEAASDADHCAAAANFYACTLKEKKERMG